MTRRAMFWCGYADITKPLDFPASVHDLGLAAQAARALGVSDENMHAFLSTSDLLPVDYAKPHYHPATVEALQRVTAAIAPKTSPEDALLFIATNHGVTQGLMTSISVDPFGDPPDEMSRVLTPLILERCLSRIPGPQILVIAACYAGVFLPLGDRADRVVLAACGPEQRYRVQKEHPPCSPFLVELLGGWCGAGLEGVRRAPLEGLDAAFISAGEKIASAYPVEHKALKPVRNGTAIWPPLAG